MFALILLAVVSQTPVRTPPAKPAPKPPAATAAELAARRQSELTRTNQLKKIASLKKAAGRSARAQAEYQSAVAHAAWLERMQPVWAEERAEARDTARVMVSQQIANSSTVLANAAQREAAAREAEVKIEARQAGYPQVGLYQSIPR